MRRLGWEEFLVVLSPEDACASRRGIRLVELKDRDWVMFEPGNGLHDLIVSACASAGFTLRHAVLTSQVETAARLAAAGVGPTLVPENVIPDGLDGAPACRPAAGPRGDRLRPRAVGPARRRVRRADGRAPLAEATAGRSWCPSSVPRLVLVDREAERVAGHHELRRSVGSRAMATGTLAARRDAPVPPSGVMSPADPMSCGFCAHAGAVRDFLSWASRRGPPALWSRRRVAGRVAVQAVTAAFSAGATEFAASSIVRQSMGVIAPSRKSPTPRSA